MKPKKPRTLDEIARKFQDEMVKLGLGVNITVNDAPAVVVTSYCEEHNIVVRGSGVCPACASRSEAEGAQTAAPETREETEA